MSLAIDSRMAWGVCLVLLLAALSSYRVIPFGPFWGLDLHNLYAFHQCSVGENPYLVDPDFCGDVLRRPMIYPPGLYWSFFWIRPFEFGQAIWIWSVMSCVGLAWALRVWTRGGPRLSIPSWILIGLTCVQMPMGFSIERGNNDIWVVVLWTLGLVCVRAKKWKRAGVFLGIACAFKIYPIAAVGVIVLGALAGRKISPVSLSKLIVGVLTAVLFCVLLFAENSVTYWHEVVPQLIHAWTYPSPFNHSLVAHFGQMSAVRLILQLGLLISWILASMRWMRTDIEWVLAGTLAISTYFSGIAFDYSLITVFPLFFLLIGRVQGSRNPLNWGVLALGIVAVFTRGLMPLPLQIGLQIFWLIGMGWFSCLRR